MKLSEKDGNRSCFQIGPTACVHLVFYSHRTERMEDNEQCEFGWWFKMFDDVWDSTIHLSPFPITTFYKNPFQPDKVSYLLPGLSEFIDKMKETWDVDERVKTTLQSLLKSRSFTSSGHSVYQCEEFEAPCTRYWAWGEICLATLMSGRFDLFLREIQSKEEYIKRREQRVNNRTAQVGPDKRHFLLLYLSLRSLSVLSKQSMGIKNNIMFTSKIVVCVLSEIFLNQQALQMEW